MSGDVDEGAPWNRRAPGWFWWAAGLCFLWNVLGAALFVMSDLRPQGAMNVLPAWVTAADVLAVGASLAGSVLMLARVRHAAVAYALSFAGAAGGITWHYAYGAWALDAGFAPRAVVEAGGILVQLWLSRRMFWLGVLR
jgi:hypothetical protein